MITVLLAAGPDPVLAAGPESTLPAVAVDRWSAVLKVKELSVPSGFRLRVTYAPDVAPGFPEHLFLVQADSAFGDSPYLIPTDIALEYGESIYRVSQDRISNLFGSVPGGRIPLGKSQVGFFFAPEDFDVPGFLGNLTDTLRIRYANRRTDFVPMSAEADWDHELPPGTIMASINAWWDWKQASGDMEPVSEGDAWLMADRLMPGQADLVLSSHIPLTALRNTILRVGDRRLVRTPLTQRVMPRYPTAARQAGVGGLVVVLAYTSERGAVEDVVVLASNTAHLLNFAAAEAVGQWRFVPAKDIRGKSADGWRLIPIQFQIGESRLPPVSPIQPPAAARTEAAVLRKAPADYPDKAFHRRIEGTVIYEVRVNTSGRLVEAVLVQSVHPLLDESALLAVEKCLFAPAQEGGVPVEDTLRISYVFPPPVGR